MLRFDSATFASLSITFSDFLRCLRCLLPLSSSLPSIIAYAAYAIRRADAMPLRADA